MMRVFSTFLLIIFMTNQSYAKIRDIISFEFGEFLRFAIELSEKSDISFSADSNKIKINFKKDLGKGTKRAKDYIILWEGKNFTINFRKEFSYVRYFIIPMPYKIIVDVGFGKKDVDEIILDREDEEKKKNKVIVIDAGHGGRDPGTMWEGIKEKDINLKLVKKIYEEIIRNSVFRAILTRKEDKFISLDERSAIANATECDIFVSIHVNSSEKRNSPSGFEIFYFSQKFSNYALRIAQKENGVRFDQGSKILFDIYSEFRENESYRLAKKISERIKSLKKVRTIEGAPLYVLAGTFCPAVLIEIGFIDNPEDFHSLRSDTFLKRLAKEIFLGIKDFLEG